MVSNSKQLTYKEFAVKGITAFLFVFSTIKFQAFSRRRWDKQNFKGFFRALEEISLFSSNSRSSANFVLILFYCFRQLAVELLLPGQATSNYWFNNLF